MSEFLESIQWKQFRALKPTNSTCHQVLLLELKIKSIPPNDSLGYFLTNGKGA